jgi:predicted Na+-dependent transporter
MNNILTAFIYAVVLPTAVGFISNPFVKKRVEFGLKYCVKITFLFLLLVAALYMLDVFF